MNCGECGNFKLIHNVEYRVDGCANYKPKTHKTTATYLERYNSAIKCQYFKFREEDAPIFYYKCFCTHNKNYYPNAFQQTGYCKLVRDGECNVGKVNAILKTSEWKVGDWCYNFGDSVIGKITGIYNIYFTVCVNMELCNGEICTEVPIDFIRSVQPSDWKVEVDGVKYRAYEDNEEGIILTMKNKDGKIDDDCEINGFPYFRYFCRLAQIPIMPYSLSNGIYKQPE
jgi:hypothetical protein